MGRTPRDLSGTQPMNEDAEVHSRSGEQQQQQTGSERHAITEPSAALALLQDSGIDANGLIVVTLDLKRQMMLGIDVDWTDGKTLYIKSVQPGAIQEWNITRTSQEVVQAGSRILAVNGFAGDPVAMAGLCRELCMSQGRLQLLVRGPPLPPPLPRSECRNAISGQSPGAEEEKVTRHKTKDK